ncbi:hypothetical protein C1645_832130 [Glomus cerebriforme]|uniref:Uncharacterized protein n=1 Tax=Glomus cerebriforme TaxID=658196 RepID=A0A397SEV9_9GLOM|nr:hypothetical protein C1645_832130 [Glomus cerebriforme]
MDNEWKNAKLKLENLFTDSKMRGTIKGQLLRINMKNRLEYFEGNDEEIKASLNTLVLDSQENLGEIVRKAVSDEFSRQNPDKISASKISIDKMRGIMNAVGLRIINLSENDLEEVKPVPHVPFTWDTKRDEDKQMTEVKDWFVNALKLPKNFFISDSHKQAKHQVYLQDANITITGVGHISIGPSKTPCVWVGTKKKREYFKQGQAIAELFLLDRICPLTSLVVLTDCNDEWIIYCFLEYDGNKDLATFEISNRGIALAIIKQFVLAEGETFHNNIGKRVNYKANLPAVLQKKIKFFTQIPENDDSMTEIFEERSNQELFNMSMRRGLRALQDISNIDQLPYVDQFIKLFNDDYENYDTSPSSSISPPTAKYLHEIFRQWKIDLYYNYKENEIYKQSVGSGQINKKQPSFTKSDNTKLTYTTYHQAIYSSTT